MFKKMMFVGLLACALPVLIGGLLLGRPFLVTSPVFANNSDTFTGHSSKVTSVAFSPDGKRIVSSSIDKTINVWDAKSGRKILTLKKKNLNGFTSVSLSPDGKQIVSSCEYKGTLRVWDANTGHELRTLNGQEGGGSITSVAFSPNGKSIVSGSHDHSVKVWDVETGLERLTLKGHKGNVNSVAFSPDSKLIVSGGSRMVRVWDAKTGRVILTLSRVPLIGHANNVTGVVFSPDGKRIVSSSWDKTVKVWDAKTGRRLLTLKGHEGWVNSVAFSPDGKLIVSGGGPWYHPPGPQPPGGSDHTVRVWDAKTGQAMHTLKGHANGVTSVAFSPDGKQVVSGSLDFTVKVWNLPSLAP